MNVTGAPIRGCTLAFLPAFAILRTDEIAYSGTALHVDSEVDS